MNLHDPSLEKTLFITAFRGNKAQRAQCLANLTAYDFFAKPLKEAWQRYQYIIEHSGRVPSWDELVADTAIPDSSRKLIRRITTPPLQPDSDAHAVILKAKELSQLRKIWSVMVQTNKAMQEEEVNIEALLTGINDGVLAARNLKNNTQNEISHLGLNSVEGKRGITYMIDFLKGRVKRKIPTGFDPYDKENTGIPYGSLTMLGGPTGGGKSIMIAQIAANMAMAGKRIAHVSLEMNEEEVYPRYLANITNTSLTAMGILEGNNRIPTKKRKELAKIAYAWQKEVARRGGLLSLYCPQSDVEAMELMFNLAPYKYDVICIDYIGLLGGLDGDNQWRRMSEACRVLKRYAMTNQCVVIIAVQVNDEGKVRYSQGMVENSDIAWLWGKNKEDEVDNTGQMHIIQLKARGSKQYDFFLHRDSDIMRIGDDTNRLKAPWQYFYKLKSMTAKELNEQQRNGSITLQNTDPNSDIANEDLGLNDLDEEEIIEDESLENPQNRSEKKISKGPARFGKKTGLKRSWAEARKNPPRSLKGKKRKIIQL